MKNRPKPMTPGRFVLFIFALAELTQAGKIDPGFLYHLRLLAQAIRNAKR